LRSNHHLRTKDAIAIGKNSAKNALKKNIASSTAATANAIASKQPTRELGVVMSMVYSPPLKEFLNGIIFRCMLGYIGGVPF